MNVNGWMILGWKKETEIEKLMELKALIQELTIPTYFATMGASNCVWVEGNLPNW